MQDKMQKRELGRSRNERLSRTRLTIRNREGSSCGSRTRQELRGLGDALGERRWRVDEPQKLLVAELQQHICDLAGRGYTHSVRVRVNQLKRIDCTYLLSLSLSPLSLPLSLSLSLSLSQFQTADNSRVNSNE